MNDNPDDVAARLRRAAGAPDAPELDAALVAGAAERRAPRLVRHGQLARGASLSIAAIAAVSAGALVVANPFAPPAPLFTATASGGTGETAALSSDARIGLWVDFDYLAGEGLSSAEGRGTVYELRRSGEPEAVLATIANAIGLAGDAAPSSYSTAEYPSFVVGPEDGSGPSLTLSWVGTGSWWYNDPGAYPAAVCTDVAIAGDDGVATGETFEDCRQPETPASESLAPSEAEARAHAARLFAGTGFEVASDDIRVTSDAWHTVATASLVVDGIPTALESSIAWSPLGEIAWASGHSIDVVERGEHATVSAVAAVDRLEDGRWFGAPGPDYSGGAVAFAAASGLARDTSASDVPVTSDGDPDADTGSDSGSDAGTDAVAPTEPVAPDAPVTPDAPVDAEPLPLPAPEDAPSGEPTIEPDVVDPLPAPETVTVTLETAAATLLLMWDVDGNAWLVPGYAFENPQQSFWTAVASLVEGVIALPEPAEFEILPAG